MSGKAKEVKDPKAAAKPAAPAKDKATKPVAKPATEKKAAAKPAAEKKPAAKPAEKKAPAAKPKAQPKKKAVAKVVAKPKAAAKKGAVKKGAVKKGAVKKGAVKKEAAKKGAVKAGAKKGAAKKVRPSVKYVGRPVPYPHGVHYNYTSHLRSRKRAAKKVIFQLLGTPVEGDLAEALRSGVLLGKLINKVSEGAVAGLQEGKLDEAQRRKNVALVKKALKGLKVSSFAYKDLVEGANFERVLNTLTGLKRVALKAGKLKAVTTKVYASHHVPVGVPSRLRHVTPKPPKKVRKTKKAKGKSPAKVSRAAVLMPRNPLYHFNYPAYPVKQIAKTSTSRERYLKDLQTDQIPKQFLVKLLAQPDLHEGLIVVGLRRGLAALKKGQDYIVPPQGAHATKTVAFSCLRFLGFQLIPTTKVGGGDLVVADKRRKAFIPQLLRYFDLASKRYLGVQ